MKKKTYSALLLLAIVFSSLAKPSAIGPLLETQHYIEHHISDIDTAESPDEFLRSPVREQAD